MKLNINNLRDKVRNVLSSDKSQEQTQPEGYKRRYTKNAQDFHTVRLAKLEVVNPVTEEPVTYTAADGRKEQYLRAIDENLPFITVGKALEQGLAVRARFLAVHDEVILKDGKVYEVIHDRHVEKKYIVATRYNEIGSYDLRDVEDYVERTLPGRVDEYGQMADGSVVQNGLYRDPKGRVWESPCFTHIITISAMMYTKDSIDERVLVTVELPIYNGNSAFVKKARDEFKQALAHRLSLNWEQIKAEKNFRPEFKSADGWLLRWNFFDQLGSTKFKVYQSSPVDQVNEEIA